MLAGLDFDNCCAEVAEVAGGDRPRGRPGEVDDLQAIEYGRSASLRSRPRFGPPRSRTDSASEFPQHVSRVFPEQWRPSERDNGVAENFTNGPGYRKLAPVPDVPRAPARRAPESGGSRQCPLPLQPAPAETAARLLSGTARPGCASSESVHDRRNLVIFGLANRAVVLTRPISSR